MKKRLVKKWINRYLKPLIEDLPRTTYINDRINITLINGERIPEACTYNIESNPRKAVFKQLKGLQEVLDQYKGREMWVRVGPQAMIDTNQNYHMGPEYVRKNPRLRFYGVRMRILIQKP